MSSFHLARGADPARRLLRLAVAVAAVSSIAALTACGSGSSAPPAVAVQAAAASAVAGGAAVALHADVTGTATVPTWTLSGPGRLSAASGKDVTFLPPGPEALDAPSTATVTATLGNGLSSQVSLPLATAPGHAWSSLRDDVPLANSVAFDAGLFVVAGAGTLRTSADGVSWTTVYTGPTTQFFYSVVHGTAGWVAGDSDGNTVTSTDGVTWSAGAPVAEAGNAPVGGATIIFGNGLYLATRNSAPALISADLVHWTTTGTSIVSAAFGNGLFVAGTDNLGDVLGKLKYSADGVNWTYVGGYPWDTVTATSVAYAGGVFIGVFGGGGSYFSSTDGMTWNLVDGGSTWAPSGMVQGAGHLFVAGYAALESESVDGTSWFDVGTLKGDFVTGIAFDGSTYVRITMRGGIATSADGLAWTPRVDASPGDLVAVASGNGHSVALSWSGTQFTSADGAAWTPSTMWTPANVNQSFAPYSVAFGNGTWVAAGFLSGQGPSRDQFLRSTDGVTWSPAASAPANVGYCNATIHDGARFVCIDGVSALSSTDGDTWTTDAAYPIASPPSGLAFGHGVYVAVDAQGRVVTSADRQAWTVRMTEPGALFAVAWNGEHFVAVGSAGAIFASDDGLAWNAAASGTTARLMGVAGVAGQFIAVGEGGTMRVSADAVTWTARTSASSVTANAITFAGGQYIVVGADSTIQKSDH
jgi:hypothetical protein